MGEKLKSGPDAQSVKNGWSDKWIILMQLCKNLNNRGINVSYLTFGWKSNNSIMTARCNVKNPLVQVFPNQPFVFQASGFFSILAINFIVTDWIDLWLRFVTCREVEFKASYFLLPLFDLPMVPVFISKCRILWCFKTFQLLLKSIVLWDHILLCGYHLHINPHD